MSFASMVSVANTRPVETYVGRVVDAVTTYAKNKGLRTETAFHTVNLPTEDSMRVVLTFKLTSDIGSQDAITQITINNYSGEARIHAAEGFPPDFQPLLHDLPALALGGENSSGVQAVHKDDAAQGVGGRGVGQAPTQTDQAIAQGVVALFDIATVKANPPEEARRYLGASGIGGDCFALHALTLRGFPGDQPSPQLIRIFNEGHRIEEEVVAALKSSGHSVQELDPSTGKQWSFRNLGGHHRANLDGLIVPIGAAETMTLEIKSMNRDKFKSFQTKGVKLSHPSYYDQVQDGMGLAREVLGDSLNKCMLVAYCKDNSQYHVEVVPFNQTHFNALMTKAAHIITGLAATRKGVHSNEYDCKQCFKRTSCWSPEVEPTHCSLCAHSVPSTDLNNDSSWDCALKGESNVSQVCGSFRLFRPRAKR